MNVHGVARLRLAEAWGVKRQTQGLIFFIAGYYAKLYDSAMNKPVTILQELAHTAAKPPPTAARQLSKAMNSSFTVGAYL